MIKNSPFSGLFFFDGGFQAFRANFQILAAGFLALKIDGHGSFCGNVGMRAALGGLGSAAADLAKSRHNKSSCLINLFRIS